MSLELFNLYVYSIFVWSAFIITFVSCFALYLKTRREYLKQQRIFLETFDKSIVFTTKTRVEKNRTKELLSGSSI